MTNRVQDACLGAILLLFAGGWTWLVVDTIPLGLGDGDIGARAFPLAYGIILLVLVVLLLLRLLAAKKKSLTPIKVTDAEMSGVGKIHWLPMLMVLIEIILYGFLLEKIGFVLATPIVVLLGMIFNLHVRSVPKLLGMSFGLTVGCWLIFEKVLGIYLANGTWFNIG